MSNGRCFHDLPVRTSLIVDSLTPKCAARSRGLPPARIFLTSASVSLTRPARSPRARFARPFALRSRILSSCVPTKRCAGFTQGGLSQRCRTQRPSGTGEPWCSSQLKCVELHIALLPIPNLPYPSGVAPPVHGQHSSGPFLLTFSQKRSDSDAFFGMRNTITKRAFNGA